MEKKQVELLLEKYYQNIPERFRKNEENLIPHQNYGLFLQETEHLGAFDVRNKLNDMGGKEWLHFLNSVEVTSYPVNGKNSYCHRLRKRHPSPKPPQLMEKLIRFFTKENQWILDPFAGVGGTLLGASLSNRNAVGIDLSEEYREIYQQVTREEGLAEQTFLIGNSKRLDQYIKDSTFDFIVTDPPYSSMLSQKKTGEQKKKKQEDSPTPFTDSQEDLGNMEKEDFLSELKYIIALSVERLQERGYLVVFVKDLQPAGKELNMLHYEVAAKLNQIPPLYYKGMKIWYDQTINLYPFGYPYAYRMNQLHQYILIFRKE